jgi:aminomethyltransferase
MTEYSLRNPWDKSIYNNVLYRKLVLKRTPLYEQHVALGARMVEFNAWEMPVQYSSIVEEHQAVRTRAGLFDVSHMGEFKIEGKGALAFLQSLVPNDVGRLAVHQALYTQLCNPNGGVMDDLLVYRLAEQQYMLVVNAGNIQKDFTWIQQRHRWDAVPEGVSISDWIQQHPQWEPSPMAVDVTITDQSKTTALLSLQGPAAEAILQPLTQVELSSIRYYHCATGQIDGINCIISRTGYTGEDGFELYCAPVDVVKLWQMLLETGKPQGLLPAGLGARDTLRLEAGMCLSGHELDESINPFEARLGWSVKLDKGPFIGRDKLLTVKQQGPEKLLMGIEMLEDRIARNGYAIILADGEQIGTVTSGSIGPTVGKNIGMGYVKAAHAIPGQPVKIVIRSKQVAARLVTLPFYKRPKH